MTLPIQPPRLMHTSTAATLGAIALWTLSLPTTVHANPAVTSTPRDLKEFTPVSQRAVDLSGVFVGDRKEQPGDRQTQISQNSPSPAPSPSYAPIPAQGGASFTTGPGVGYESSFVGMEGFIPLLQTPGKNLAYVQGRFLLSTDGGNPGGNVLVGYRQFDPSNNLILGGYLGYDVRDTGRATFGQVGVGVEGIWSDVELRLNGYIPVGSTRETVDRQTFSSTSTSSSTSSSITTAPPTALRFQGNNLLFDVTRTTTLTTTTTNTTTTLNRWRDELALGGFDLEGGLKLAQWQPDGDLRSYLGVYYYSGSGIGGFVGVRGRLVARINQYASVGVAIQGDPEFGTTGAVTVGLTFPGVNRPRVAPPDSNWARMGDGVSRSNTVAVTERDRSTINTTSTSTTSSTSSSATTTEAALNPTTGQPYVFQHVILGVAGGNGTFETPFGTVNAAMTAVPGDGNGIVYVQAGTNPGIPEFTIKDNVDVWSTGPVQNLATTQFGPIALPLSGSGTLPTVIGTVTMGNNTGLSGFTVTPPAGTVPIAATNVRDVTIEDNVIQATGNNIPGIRLQDVTGTALITDNRISSAGTTTLAPNGAHGVSVTTTGTTLDTLILTNNQVATTGGADAYGILLRPTGGGSITNTTISNNRISTTGNNSEGIMVLPNGGSLGTIAIANNTIANTGLNAEGVVVIATNSPIANLAVTNNAITIGGNNAAGVWVQPVGSTLTTTTIAGNTIATQGTTGAINHGVYVRPNNGNMPTLSIANNTISTTALNAEGIFLSPTASTFATVNVSGNTITTLGDGSEGILLQPNQAATSPIQFAIANNTIRQSGGFGIYLNVLGATQATATISNNTVTNARDIGIIPVARNTSQLRVTVDSNQVTNVILGGAQLGISVETSETGRLFANVLNNRVANPNAFAGANGVEYKVQNLVNGNTCIRAINNTASLSGFFLRNDGAAGQLQVEPLVGNVGTIQPPTGGSTPVAAGTCGF